ncbi:hypothetical protein GOB98_10510 [Sinorhizobium meliloti]|nr:hypothetical protein [Sinorhizobium meliloti]MDW9976521.1 hypothetical protein [Sinorhizobium meliloti]
MGAHPGPRQAMVVQPWIEPGTVIIAGNERYYDVRLFVLDGEIIGAFARCSVAPRGGVGAGTELEWLTTLGSISPIATGTDGCAEGHVALSNVEAALLHQLAWQVASRLDVAAAELAQEGGSRMVAGASRPARRVLPVMFVAPSITEQADEPSMIALTTATQHDDPIAVVDVGSDPAEWESLRLFTGWPLMPQVLVGGESFLGCHVIGEAITSGELNRAARPPVQDHFSSIELPISSVAQDYEAPSHRAEVWGGSTTSKGIIRATAAADGTIRIVHGDESRLFKITSNWINSISLSQCGQVVVCGTSNAEAFVIEFRHLLPVRLSQLQGHRRWVNGVRALDRRTMATVSSDGHIVLWRDNKAVAQSRHSACGHILGMRLGRDQTIITWSSNGSVARWRGEDLSLVSIWTAPTARYVTVATEATISAHCCLIAVDDEGTVYSSMGEEPLFKGDARSWVLVAIDAIGAIVLATITGAVFVWRHSQPSRPLQILRTASKATPTFAELIEGTSSILMGFSDGSTHVVDI